MKKYNKFYFLHVPKTGGRFFTEYIVRPIERTLEENGVKIIQLPPNVDKHGGWHKDIDDGTYIVSILRDPAEFFASLIAHMVSYENGLIDDNNDQIINDKSRVLNIEKDFLFSTMEELKYLKNFQSQNFLLTPEDINLVTYSRRMYNKSMGLYIDNELLYERLNRTNLIIRHSDLKSMDYSLLIDKISDDIGINIKVDTSSIDKERYKNNNSEHLYNKLTDKDIKRIYENFMLDKEIYDNDSLFWTGK
jgi:hypothetical protein